MDHHVFDDLTRIMARPRDRRTLAKALGGVAAAPALAGMTRINADEAEAAKRNRKTRKPRRYKKKRKFCLNGQQVISRRKKRIRRWQRQGATKGKCPTACPAGSITVNGVCTPCTVTCSGDAVTCGAALQNALTAGGTIYVCPGTYGGNFTTGSVTVYGAGSGSDPATSAILDAQGAGRVLLVNDGATVKLTGLRFINGLVTTGGEGGGGISAGAGVNLTVTACAFAGNAANTKQGGGALFAEAVASLVIEQTAMSGNTGDNAGALRIVDGTSASLANCTITGNTAVVGGGGISYGGVPLVMTGTEVSGNTAGTAGGGVFMDGVGVALTLDSATSIVSNTATGGTGGGIYADGSGIVTKNGATISGNLPDQCSGVTGC